VLDADLVADLLLGAEERGLIEQGSRPRHRIPRFADNRCRGCRFCPYARIENRSNAVKACNRGSTSSRA
jgi:hypothetical protein